jgi:hypothetical protein
MPFFLILRIMLGALVLMLPACAPKALAPLAEPASPRKPPPILCADIPPEPEPEGGFPRPITVKEIEAVDRLRQSEIDIRAHSRAGWHRATVAKDTYC